MSILIQNVTAVLLDESRTVLPNAFVAVEGSQISYVGTKRPAGPSARSSTAPARC
jgi:5-methylthioadenosine/S-adenosylhomocysteine deaminase